MRAVGIKVLKNKLSEYVRLAASGETVLVTNHDRVVAELRPPQPGRPERLPEGKLGEAVRSGAISPRQMPPFEPLPPRKPVMTLEKLLVGLDEDRADRF